MTRALWDRLLASARAAHSAHPAISAFCPFPDDITAQPVTPFHIPASNLFQQDRHLKTDAYSDLHNAFLAVAPHAHWRETYKDTDIGDDFMSRFGCYCLIGAGGAFHSEQMCAWVVYMPARLHYPFHHHPGEEMYLVLAGQAEFLRHGAPAKILHPGDTAQHASNEPHATETHAHPLLAYVVWRNGFGTLPVLTPAEALA